MKYFSFLFLILFNISAVNLPDFTSVAQDVLPATVNISTKIVIKETIVNPFNSLFFGESEAYEVEREGSSLGSGFVISKDGLVVTNNHVVQNAAEIIIKFSDLREYEAEIIGADPSTDIALLKIKSDDKFDFLEFEDEQNLKIGEWVVAVGNPFGLNSTMTAGIVSATGRSGLGIETYENFIQTDASINPGNSGGPLINTRGKVVGVNTAIISQTQGNIGLGFAIPTSIVKRVTDNLIKYGEVKRPMLGVIFQNDFNSKVAKEFGLENAKGALVAQVIEGTPASESGLLKGDIIIAIDEKEVKSYGQAQAIISTYNPGEQIKIDLLRNGKNRTFLITLAERDIMISSQGIEVMGLTINQLDSQKRNEYGYSQQRKGVVITNVKRGTLGEQLGLRPGIIISEINKVPISNLVDFNKEYNKVGQGENLLLYVENKDFGRYVIISKE